MVSNAQVARRVFRERFDGLWRVLVLLGIDDVDVAMRALFLTIEGEISPTEPRAPTTAELVGVCYRIAKVARALGDGGRALERVDHDLADALAGMSLGQRTVFVAFEIERLEVNEIAQALGLRAESVLFCVRSARHQFRIATRNAADLARAVGEL